jgi:hypothetical protein
MFVNYQEVQIGLPPLPYRMLHSVLTNSMAQEPKGSSPHSQQFATGPYSEPVESNPHPPSQSPQDPF